jgi:hypothetical protein
MSSTVRDFKEYRRDDARSKYLWNFGKLLPDNTAHSRRLPSSGPQLVSHCTVKVCKRNYYYPQLWQLPCVNSGCPVRHFSRLSLEILGTETGCEHSPSYSTEKYSCISLHCPQIEMILKDKVFRACAQNMGRLSVLYYWVAISSIVPHPPRILTPSNLSFRQQYCALPLTPSHTQ